MSSIHLIKQPPSASHHASATDARSAASEFPPLWERLNDILPLVFFVPMAGPPVILLLGPLLLIVLLLIPPTAVLITLVVVAVVAAGVLVALVGLLASPYLLVRHLRKHRVRHPELISRRQRVTDVIEDAARVTR